MPSAPPKPLLSRSELQRRIRAIPGTLGPPYALAWTAEEARAALVMLAALNLGSRDARAVSRFTGVPLRAVERYYRRLSDHGIWTPDGGARVKWFPLDGLGLKAFWLDVLKATGKVERRQVVVMPPSGVRQ